jgi:hypothetical protein
VSRVPLQLPALGINSDSINFRNTTMDSDKTICIREDVGEARNIVIVDIMSRMIKHKKPMAAEAAIMNAVRALGRRSPPPPHSLSPPPPLTMLFLLVPDAYMRALAAVLVVAGLGQRAWCWL